MATATLDQTNLALHNRGASLLQRGDDFAFQSSLDEKNLYRGVLSRIGGIVLKNSTDELRECLQRAEECAQEAATRPYDAWAAPSLSIKLRSRRVAILAHASASHFNRTHKLLVRR